MAAHHDTSGRPPASKKSKTDDGAASNNGSSYIPTERDSGLQFSVVFSMKEEKGALVKALELCKVRRHSVKVTGAHLVSMVWLRLVYSYRD